MKNFKVILLLVVCLIISFNLSAFGSDQKYKIEPVQLTMGAGGMGGSWFVMATALFSMFDEYIDGLEYTIVPGGGVANPIAIKQKNIDIGLAYTTNLWAAHNGKLEYEEPIENIRGMAKLGMADVIHCFMLSRAGINSIKEIAEKKTRLKLDTSTLGLSGELGVKRMLELHGITYDDIKSWGGSVTHSSYQEATDRLRDGHIDGFFNIEVVGKPLWTELTQSVDATLLTQEEEALVQLVEKYGYDRAVIPAGTYKGQEKDIATTSQEPVLVVDKDMDEELVYILTKLLFEHKDYLVTTYATFKYLDINDAIPAQAPLHPGAERYYKEVGVLK